MNFNPYMNWLGISKPSPVAGLHITANHMTLIVLQRQPGKSNPARLVAIGREAVPDGVVVGTEIRLVDALVVTLKELVSQTRVAAGTPTVATIEPLAATATISDEGKLDEPSYEVSQQNYQRTADIVTRSGLELARVDIVPAALARFGRQIGWNEVALRSPGGWSVMTSPFFTDAERLVGREPTALLAGRDFGEAIAVEDLVGVEVPDRLRSVVDPGLDAIATGAALAGLGQPPLVSVTPVGIDLPPPPVRRTAVFTAGAFS